MPGRIPATRRSPGGEVEDGKEPRTGASLLGKGPLVAGGVCSASAGAGNGSARVFRSVAGLVGKGRGRQRRSRGGSGV